ncbi:precorrin-6y C5,15-methyltransferase (decarboxylating) subunit CbiE [Nocardioides antri]|uniref:Precorrin-6y C5,15-methyltransferase (Decarboxylating) subunit CbiE n=1 Tax=Nocardioides antri TaxID=2607659 RepID=A0A5B1M0T2_9ACTN|nr:precorrin-6y C5,15-methyltransferase (decarboxylating) subunit CbiE [Nocardioides antri]KAA1426364.1 precorrin-6y C5,15-methyltransferase (decarboxylating) subunit CbiE [Nocardioides antri]
MSARVTVVGIGADGWTGLSEAARERVQAAEVLLGGERHLGLVPPVPGQERRPWPRPLGDLPALLDEYDGRRVVALASGDPYLSGIGTTLAALVEDLEAIPAASSVAWARARMRWAAESSAVVTLVGRDVDALRRELAPGRRLLVLSSDETTPAAVAALLREEGLAASRMSVLGDLGSDEEHRIDGTAAEMWRGDLPRLHVLALEVSGPPTATTSWAAGLPDEAFEHDGQLTKRDLRASALSRLAPRPGALLWDVGSGAGSIAIEWLRAHPTTEAVAIEVDPDRAARIARNAARLGVPRLRVVTGRAPDALADLPVPDAVFIGGGGSEELVTRCLAALAPHGRLVAHGVTLETEQLLASSYQRHGGELTRIAVEHAARLGGLTGWTPFRTVTQWTVTR